jgi:uncharacterized protein YndB with AHSA1/START domain
MSLPTLGTLGTLLPATRGRSTLRFERQLRHPVERVWRAITDPAELESWFPSRVELGELALGARLHFVFETENVEPMDGQITELEPPRVLGFSWGSDQLRFELEPTAQGCQLVFSCTFTNDGLKAARDAAGWHVCLDRLEAQVDGRPVAWGSNDRWQELHPAYVAQMGGKLMSHAEAVDSARAGLARERAQASDSD